MIWRREGSFGKLRHAHIHLVWKDAVVYLGAFVALLLGARFLVFSSIISASLLKIPTYIISLFVIGIGASIGDLSVDINSIKSGHKQMAISDSLSGLVVEMLFILGIISIIKPIAINPTPLLITAPFAILPLAGILYFAKKEITRKHSIILLSIYAAFVIAQVAWVMM